MSNKENFEKIYEEPNAVWTRETPPKEIVDLVEKKKIEPCKTLDVGCGEGIYSIYLAKKGFDVLGIDFSKKAIEYARENAKEENADVRFKVLDIENLEKINEKFDFIFEWGLLHHIMTKIRKKYVNKVSSILNKGGKYFSMCFNVNSKEFGGSGVKYRESPTGDMYYAPKEEMEELFKPYFKILEKKLIDIPGDGGHDHVANYFLMEK